MKLVNILLYMVNMLGQATWIQLNFKLISLWKGCHQLPKRGRLKALVWFWWIYETLSANRVHLSDHETGSIIPSGEAMVKIMMMMMAWWWSNTWTWKSRKRKTKSSRQRWNLIGAFSFWWSRHLVSVITFRIDSRTIKMGETRTKMRLSKCHYMF